MIAVKQRTLGRGPGVSNFLFGVYTILVALLGASLAYRGGALVAAGGSPYYAMMGTALLLSAILIGLKQARGIYLYGAASLATYAWAIWESGYDGWAFIPRLAWLAVLSVPFLAFWPLVRRDFSNAKRSHYFTIMGLLPILMAITILVPLFFPTTVHLADSTLATTRPEQPFSRNTVTSPDGNCRVTRRNQLDRLCRLQLGQSLFRSIANHPFECVGLGESLGIPPRRREATR
ncbi:hypothetical protein [Pseudomonas sp. ZB1P45]|uniref:hypothetical protein n=1 Tax=Pseudomonas frigoris TaxID=3398356 RepID=UPI0039F12DC3